ncbi:MAG: glycosyltransferase family 4 protein [Armatimonadia bacterium]
MSLPAHVLTKENRLMNVLMLGRNAQIGGGNTYKCTVMPALEALGHRVHLMVGLGPYRKAMKQACGGKVFLNLPGSILVRSQLPGLVRALGIDVVNAHGISATNAAATVCQRLGIPLVSHVHGLINLQEATPGLEAATRVVALNVTTGRWVSQVPGVAEKTVVSYLPVDVTRFQQRDAAPGEGFTVAYVARLSKVKSRPAYALMEAVLALNEQIPGLKLQIVGGRSQVGKVRQRAAEINSMLGRQAVEVTGPRFDVEDVYHNAAVVVGTGYVALEALACGRHVIAAGSMGLIGYLRESNFIAARDANFGDHAAPGQGTAEDYTGNLLEAYDAWQEEPTCQWAPPLIERDFSPQGAADDLVTVFSDAISECRR